MKSVISWGLASALALMAPVGVQAEGTIDVHVGAADGATSIGAYGTNTLFWIDKNAQFSSDEFIGRLREGGVTALRFPGGEVADNYDWETNRLVDPSKFPYEKAQSADAASRLNYLEFLTVAKKAGIENLFFVVNLESAFAASGDLQTNLEAYADKAARWVAAVKKAGYRVPYWEIGNESYFGNLFGLTAHEYATAVKLFARKMKAADPKIKIGALGPFALEGPRAVSFADHLGGSPLQNYRSDWKAKRLKCGGDDEETGAKVTCVDAYKDSGSPLKGGPVWWEVVSREAGADLDFAVVHRYRNLATGAAGKKEMDKIGSDVRRLKELLSSRKGAPVMLAMTEWNMPNGMAGKISETEHALKATLLYQSYVRNGVDYALYWPMRLPGTAFTLLGMQDLEPSLAYQAMRLNARYSRGKPVSSRMKAAGDLHVFVSRSGSELLSTVVNAGTQTQCLRFVGGNGAFSVAQQERLVVGDANAKIVSGSVAGGSQKDRVCVGGKELVGARLTR